MDKALYPDPILFLRELLQNSLDACRMQSALASEQRLTYYPRIFVVDLSDDESDPRIIFQDNGIGMSEEIVKNFFLRIGRSYYRSNEFLATRERLHAQGIQLEACSQFGIGFLSCFLGGDKIDVDTYQWGSHPLTIHIDGPSKYFLIKRHESAPARLNPFCAEDDPAWDGPPAYPGTRVTVHLKPGWRVSTREEQESGIPKEGIVSMTLRKFAVNVDVPITIQNRTARKDETAQYLIIKARRWDEEVPLLPEGLPEFWRDYLCPVRIPFENFEETRDIRGGAWFWFLKGQDGKPTHRRGFCSVTGCLRADIHVTDPILNIAAKLFGLISFGRIAVSDVKSLSMKFRKELSSILDSIWLDEEGISILESEGIDVLVRIIQGKFRLTDSLSSDTSMLKDQKLVRALFEGDRPKVLRQLKTTTLYLRKSLDCGFHLAQFGILIPAGILDFQPLQAKSEHVKPFLPLPITARCDLWGASAIPPSANRLNLPYQQTSHLRLILGYAAVETLHSIILGSGKPKDWIKWIESISVGGNYTRGLEYAWEKDRCLFIRDNLNLKRWDPRGKWS